jgi:hypothetical protein
MLGSAGGKYVANGSDAPSWTAASDRKSLFA